jgi:pSer/pThr/pTyr-binding forkhead associated (FHA) protein
MFQLESTDDLGRKLTFPLVKVKTTVGRDPASDIVLSDPDVSRRHLRIYVMNEMVRVKDEGSVNGTFVNNRLIQDMTDVPVGGELIVGSNQFFVREVEQIDEEEENLHLTMMLSIDQLRDMTRSFDVLAEEGQDAPAEDVGDTAVMSKGELLQNIYQKKISVKAHPSIEVIFGPDKGKRFILRPGDYRVGRGADCNVRLDDPMVSTLHGLIEVGEDAIVYNDADSRNGSVLNNKIVDMHPLKHRDVLVIGNTKLKFVDPAKGSAADTPAEAAGPVDAPITMTAVPWYAQNIVWITLGLAATVLLVFLFVLFALE